MWVGVYALIIRRGIKDKSYGMPLTSVALNLSWELYTSIMRFDASHILTPKSVGVILDVGVLITCYLYAQNEFDRPLLRKRFRLKLTAFLLSVGGLEILFMRAFHDSPGAIAATFDVLFYAPLFVLMILMRDSVRGQSLYIGLLIFFGDLIGYGVAVYNQQTGQENMPILWLNGVYVFAMIMHGLYIGIYVHVAKRDGVSLWKRF